MSNENTVLQGSRNQNRPSMLDLPTGLRCRLDFVEGPDANKTVFLNQSYNIIGRHATADVTIATSTASSRHAAIYFSLAREWRIEDLDSTNGTLLNGSAVKEFALRDGDKIFIGDDLIVFSIERVDAY